MTDTVNPPAPHQAPPASQQDGTYPRPQLVRPAWADLTGTWEFDFASAAEADADRLSAHTPYGHTIVVPYPPEAPLSGVADTGYHPVVWYRRHVTAADIAGCGHGDGRRLLLHFGAVDYRADVWAGGQHVGRHEGGHTPFTVDVTAAATSGFDIVVRAEDDPLDLEQPRGKQDWEPRPHSIWYERTTGIWQPVWLESVPRQHVRALAWLTDVANGQVTLGYEVSERSRETAVRVLIAHDGVPLAEATSLTEGQLRGRVVIPLAVLGNGQGYERLLWSPERPVLLDAAIELRDPAGRVVDAVTSYLGLRTVGTGGGQFLLNDRPYHVRAVLSQGYWPQSHLAAPSAAALSEEVRLIKELGFNTARLHQKIEDPRLLYWADRLGLLVWEELPSAYEFSATSISRLTREWTEAIQRDRSHPSVAVWVPMNESWGVQQAAHRPEQRHFLQALYHLAKALDPTRLVVSNDGWEHADSDLLTVHDYDNDVDSLTAAYADDTAVASTIAGIGPGQRVIRLLPEAETPGLAHAPVMVSEFGGVALDPGRGDGSWGYAVVADTDQLERQLRGVVGALQASRSLAGWCYTQLTDTVQETNGLTDACRRPKLNPAVVRAIIQDA